MPGAHGDNPIRTPGGEGTMDNRRDPEEIPFEDSLLEGAMDIQDEPAWQTDPLTPEEEAAEGYRSEDGELCETEEEAANEALSNQLDWWKTSHWNHADEALWAAIGDILAEFEERTGFLDCF